MRPSSLRWGLIFILAGIMLLLTNADYLDGDYWWNLLSWWPLLLIAIGIEKIFYRSSLKYLAYISPLLITVAMIWIAFDTGKEYYGGFDFFGVDSSERWELDMDEQVDKIIATVDHGRNDIRISRSSFNMASARFDRLANKPDIDYNVTDGVVHLDIEERGHRSSTVRIIGHRVSNDWRLLFTDDIPLDLNCIGEDSDINLNLERIQIERLKVDNEDGRIYVKIGDNPGKVDLDIAGDDADCKIRVPETAGVSVIGEKYQAYLETLGYTMAGNEFKSPGFDSSGVKINLKLDDNLGSLSILSY